MYTYIIYDDKYYKIGKTKNLKNRMESMKTSNPHIKLLLFLDKDIEKDLHVKFKDRNITGEWFNLSKEDLEYLHNTMYKNEDIKVTTKLIRIIKVSPDKNLIRQKRYENMKVLNQDRVNNTKKDIEDIIDSWDFGNLKKITQTKLISISGKNKKTIEKYYPEFKEKIIKLYLHNSK